MACRAFSHLQALELCGGSVSDVGVRWLGTLKALSSLSLAHNARVTDRASLTLACLQQLTALNLTATQLTGNGILPFCRLTVRDVLTLGPQAVSLCACPRSPHACRLGLSCAHSATFVPDMHQYMAPLYAVAHGAIVFFGSLLRGRPA